MHDENFPSRERKRRREEEREEERGRKARLKEKIFLFCQEREDKSEGNILLLMGDRIEETVRVQKRGRNQRFSIGNNFSHMKRAIVRRDMHNGNFTSCERKVQGEEKGREMNLSSMLLPRDKKIYIV